MMSIYVKLPYSSLWDLDLDLILFVSYPCVARVTSSVRILACGVQIHKRKACRLTFIHICHLFWRGQVEQEWQCIAILDACSQQADACAARLTYK